MICKYSYKRQTPAPHCALYPSPRQRTVGAPPALPTKKPGVKSGPPTRMSPEPGLGLSKARAIPHTLSTFIVEARAQRPYCTAVSRHRHPG